MVRPRSVLVVPANNTTMEQEMNALCPNLAPFVVARVRRPTRTLTVDDLPAYRGSTLEAIEPFLERQPDMVVYGRMAAGFLGGPAGNASVVAAPRARAAAPMVSTAAAMVDMLGHDGSTETAIVTPDLAAVNDGLCACLCSAGSAVGLRAKALASVTPASRALSAQAA